MPITINPLRSIQRKDNLELVEIVIRVQCDGTNNNIIGLLRRHLPVTRDDTGSVIEAGEIVAKQYQLSDFGAGVQTGLTNFVALMDVKP